MSGFNIADFLQNFHVSHFTGYFSLGLCKNSLFTMVVGTCLTQLPTFRFSYGSVVLYFYYRVCKITC